MLRVRGTVDTVDVDLDVDAISPVAQDYVKAIWSAVEWGDPPITTKALAARFGTSPANVTDTMRRLASQGLIDYRPYKSVQLTDTGRTLAVAMVRRHRLIETFLVTTLGYGWDEVHDEAERLEHAASDLLIGRIDELLGHPTADPHGDPIPSPDGRTHIIDGAVRLAASAPGRHLVRRVSDSDPDDLERAAALGLVPGSIVDTVGGDPVILVTAGGQRPIPESLANATWVTPGG